jgi:hypothetical protein
MAPLRKVMTSHGLPGWYAWVIVLVTMILLSGGSMALSIRSAKRAIEADRQSREATRQATCAVVSAQREAFREVPPVTQAGKKAAESWERLSRQLRCE